MQANDRQSAEAEIFALRKRIDAYLRAGDVCEVHRLQVRISELQRNYGCTTGRGKENDNDRTAG
jgi:hypothetical protein